MTESSLESPSPSESPIDLTHVKTQLGSDEELLWYCRCDAKRMEAQGKIAIFIGIPMLLFFALIFVINTIMGSPELWSNPAAWSEKLPSLGFPLLLVFFAVLLFRMPKMNREWFGNSIHVLTNKRIFISRFGKPPSWSFFVRDLEDLSSSENSDGTGDITFAYTPRSERLRRGWFTLYGIPNAKDAEKKIADAIANTKEKLV
ncbi:MAG: hypothetical protein U0105_02060 [Candidatus Obscuribacterales bacterium]